MRICWKTPNWIRYFIVQRRSVASVYHCSVNLPMWRLSNVGINNGPSLMFTLADYKVKISIDLIREFSRKLRMNSSMLTFPFTETILVLKWTFISYHIAQTLRNWHWPCSNLDTDFKRKMDDHSTYLEASAWFDKWQLQCNWLNRSKQVGVI